MARKLICFPISKQKFAWIDFQILNKATEDISAYVAKKLLKYHPNLSHIIIHKYTYLKKLLRYYSKIILKLI